MAFDWLFFSLSATILFGLGLSLYKFPAAKNQSRYVLTFWSIFTPLILSLFFFHSYLYLTTSTMILIGGLWGLSFALLVVLQMYALKVLDTSALFPITTTTSLVISVLAGLFFFSEKISMLQLLGVVLIIGLVYAYLYSGKKLAHTGPTLILLVAIALLSAFNKIILKLGTDTVDLHGMQIYMYLVGTILALGMNLWARREGAQHNLFQKSAWIGVTIGLFSFFGGYALVIALSRGPFTIITSIHSLYVFVTAVAAAFLFKESIVRKTVILMILAVAAVLLLKLG